MRNRLEISRQSFFIILITLLVMLFFAFDYAFQGFLSYLISPEYRELISSGGYKNAWDFLIKTITQSNNSFDPLIIFGSAILTVFLPLYAMVAVIYFQKKWRTIYQIGMSRSTSKSEFISSKVISNSLHVALSSFVGFLLFLFIIALVTNGNFVPGVIRPLFADWFGRMFYQDHPYLHHFMEGFLRFFYMPFIYSFLGIAVATYPLNFFIPPLVPLIYYYGLTVLSMGLKGFDHMLYLHTSPMVLMASGDFIGINTFLIILINSFPLFLGIILLKMREKYYEI